MTLSCTVNEILSLISQNLKRSRYSEHIPYGGISTHVLVLLCINQHTKFELTGFTNSKDMIGAKLKENRHVTLTTPVRE